MTSTIGYRILPPCVDYQGHRYDLSRNHPNRSVCGRCGDVQPPYAPALAETDDPTEPRTLIPLKISEALQTNHAWLQVKYLEGIYSTSLRWPGGQPCVSTGTSLAMALTHLAIKVDD